MHKQGFSKFSIPTFPLEEYRGRANHNPDSGSSMQYAEKVKVSVLGPQKPQWADLYGEPLLHVVGWQDTQKCNLNSQLYRRLMHSQPVCAQL